MIHVKGPNSTTTLTNIQDKDVQPNAIDLRLDKVFELGMNDFVLSEEEKIHRSNKEVLPNSEGWFRLKPGSYEIVFENEVQVGPDEIGWVITRSTLNRNGVFITSGLYDSGYHGKMAACLHIMGTSFDFLPSRVKIKKGTRIGQYLCFKAEALHKYQGSYGLHSEHDKKYN